MGMGNWTWPGASTIQLLSLGRWSSSKSGLKSAGDTWHYQLLSVNWEIRKPEALGTHRPVCSSLSYVSFWECEGGFDTLWSLCWCVRPRVQNICLYVKYEAVLAPAAGGVCENSRALVSTMNSARDRGLWITELGALRCWIRGWAGSRDRVHQCAVN